MFPCPQNPCAWYLDVCLTLQVFEGSLEKQKLLGETKTLSLQQLFVERLDNMITMSFQIIIIEKIVWVVYEESNLFIGLAADWWDLKLLCCPFLPVALL